MIRIDVESAAEFLALITLIGRCAVTRNLLRRIGILLRLVVGLLTAIAEQRNRARRSHTIPRRILTRLTKFGVTLDGHTLRLIEGVRPRRRVRKGCNQHQTLGKIGTLHRPLATLITTDRTTNQHRNSLDTNMFSQQSMTTHHIADCDDREVVIVGLARRRVDRQRTCRAIARADKVGTNHEVARRIEELTLLDRMLPPIGHVRVGRQRVADPNHIATIFVHRTVGVVRDAHLGQYSATIERDGRGVVEIFYFVHY